MAIGERRKDLNQLGKSLNYVTNGHIREGIGHTRSGARLFRMMNVSVELGKGKANKWCYILLFICYKTITYLNILQT